MNDELSLDLTKETLNLNKSAGREKNQLLLEGDIIAPDIKPDIAVVLRVDADIFADKKEVTEGRAAYSGKLSLQALYLSKETGKAVHSVKHVVPVEGSVNSDSITKDSTVTVSADVADVSHHMINDRKISYRVLADITVSAETTAPYSVVTGVTGLPLTQQRKRLLSFAGTVETVGDVFTVKDELVLPLGKPTALELLQTKVAVANKEVKALNGRVTVTGDLIVSVFYKGVDDDSVIEFAEHEIPFNGSIDAPASREGMTADAQITARDYSGVIKADSDGEDRVIEIEAQIAADVKVYGQTEAEVLSDAYAINQTTEAAHEKVSYPKIVFRGKSQCHVKETVVFSGAPEILQILTVTGAVSVDDVSIGVDRLTVSGAINADILYIAKSDDVPLYNYKTVVPFEQIIEAKGVTDADAAETEVTAAIDYAGFNMLGGDEAETRFIVGLNTKAVKRAEEEVVTDVKFTDMDEVTLSKFPSIVIYSVKAGDSLWKIAKRFNTGVDELVSVNEIENPEKIYPGQKLVILKNVA